MKKLLFLCASLISLAAYADDETAVTPYRPSVSSPAQLPVAGQLELELGWLQSKSSDMKRDSIPYQFKLAFNKEWGILLGGEAHVLMRNTDGSRDRGFGDTNVVLKRAFVVDDTTALGAELGVKLPTANAVIGSGKSDVTINAILSKEIQTVHMDANVNVTRLGLVESGTARLQTGLSTSFSMPLDERWGATAEVSGTHRSGVPNARQFLLAATFSPTKRMTIDFGVIKGLTQASQDWSFFSGIVLPIAKLW
ncbi:MAG: transporter [Herminiimonas sp.]|nr:transporter [Herminiimonas sp.]